MTTDASGPPSSKPGEGSDDSGARQGLAEQMVARRAARDDIAAAGIEPYPERFERTATAGELHECYDALAPDARTGETASVAGRLVSKRGHGKLEFATVRDQSGTVQLLMQRTSLDADTLVVLDHLDAGDWVGATGEVITSRRGELSIDVRQLQLLAKDLRPLPEEHRGITDQEVRYRQREADLIVNESSRRVFEIRFKTISSLRASLVAEGFVEVETPILQPQAGGAIARPFLTHYNSLDLDVSLRIAPELYLKRLVVGGFERVFEIAKDFRNEGLDTRHSPEFTALEAYRALGDFHDGMDLTERLVVAAADAATGRRTFAVGERTVDLTPPWPRHQLLDLIEDRVGKRLHPDMAVGDVRAALDQLGVAYDPSWGAGKLIFEVYDKVLQPSIVGPVFVCGYPIEVSPLARHDRADPALADRFELLITGRELANGYSELTDPDEQEARFRTEAAAAASGDLEAHPADAAFVRALQYGLPPTSGIGIGIDRLVMLFGEVPNIRDVILFPLLRPEADSGRR